MLAVLAAAVSPALANAQDYPAEMVAKDRAVILEATGPWKLDMDETGCRLSRSFGPEDAPSVLLLEQFAPRRVFQTTLAGPDIPELSGTSLYAGARSDEKTRRVYGMHGQTEYGPSLTVVNSTLVSLEEWKEADGEPITPEIALEDAAMVERFVVRQATRIVSFETGDMTEPVRALNTCAFDFLSYWGLDPDAHRGFHPPALSNEVTFLKRLMHEYAEKHATSGHKAVAHIVAMIDREGAVTDCRTDYVMTTGGDEIDPCEDLREKRFDPATDREGNAIASYYSRSVELGFYSPWASSAHGARFD